MKILPFIIFLTVVTTVWSSMHVFVFFRLRDLLELNSRSRLILKILLIILAASFFLGRLIASWLHSYLLMEISYIWLGVLSLLFFLLLLALPLNKLCPKWNGSTIWAVLFLTGLISTVGLINYARGHVVRQVVLEASPSLNLTRDIKIVQLSDLHLDRNSSRTRIQRIIEDTLSQSPDMIVITGDILEEPLPADHNLATEFSRLRAPLGVFAVTGNHELYTGIRSVEEFLKACGITLLRNQRMDLDNGLTLIGFDDDEFRRLDKGTRIKQLNLLEQLDPTRYTILLYHRPTGFQMHAQKGVNLQLSGHTHAGQTLPLNLLVFLYFKYPAGLDFFKGSAIYTSRGTGIWGPPMRFPFRSEITVLTINSSAQ